MTINGDSLLNVEANQLPDTTTVASLAISQSCAEVTQMPKLLGPKVSVMATKAMAIKAIVVVIDMVMCMPIVRTILWMPMNSRGIRLMSL